jgi:prepilin-type N-terminal cleavage/methylation domain-containing protein
MNLSQSRSARRGFSLVELVTVIGIITILLAILLPALAAGRGNAIWAKSRSNMRQIYVYMQTYSTDNREFIVPSQFDYTAASYPGLVRTESPKGTPVPLSDPPYNHTASQGTWSDILWTTSDLGPLVIDGVQYDYRYDSPDDSVYKAIPDLETVFRSPALVSSNKNPDTNSEGKLGYYAANNFFDSRPGQTGAAWYTTGEIKRPAQSMYLVDSVIGEVIEDEDPPYAEPPATGPSTLEVDFRYYGGVCNMLMLDGSTVSQNPWTNLTQLETARRVRVQELNLN